MSDILNGYDRYTQSTPFDVRRGSYMITRRTCYTRDPDSGRESVLSIAGADAVVWNVTRSLKRATPSVLTKSLGAGIVLVGTGSTGQYDLTLSESDTKLLPVGLYYACVAVVLGAKRYKFRSYFFNIQSAGDLGE